MLLNTFPIPLNYLKKLREDFIKDGHVKIL